MGHAEIKSYSRLYLDTKGFSIPGLIPGIPISVYDQGVCFFFFFGLEEQVFYQGDGAFF